MYSILQTVSKPNMTMLMFLKIFPDCPIEFL